MKGRAKDARRIVSRVAVLGSVRVDAYRVIVRAVEEGCAHGARRAFKHVEHPTPEQVEEVVGSAVIDELCEILRFDAGVDE